MNKLLQNLNNFVAKLGFKKIFWAALIIRLLLAIPFRSGDLNSPAIWGIYVREFGFSGFYDFLNFGNYGRPDYPPLSMLLFWFLRLVWEGIFAVFWKINISIPVFPSNFITWLDQDGYVFLLKLPGFFADFGIGLLLLRYGLLAATLYWFNPATIYVSSMWGQMDGVIMFLALLFIILLEKKSLVLGWLVFTASILLKANSLVLFPVVLYLSLRQSTKITNLIKAISVSIVFGFLVAKPFTLENPITWLVKNYLHKFLISAVNLPYIQLRSFNFWTLVTGFAFTPDNNLFLNIALARWAEGLGIVISLFVLWLLIKKQDFWLASCLFIFASFLFLPRMHERYLLPIFPFLIPLVSAHPKLIWVYFGVAAIHFINLYAAWQVPYTFLVNIFTIDIVARIFSLAFLAIFIFLLRFNFLLPDKK